MLDPRADSIIYQTQTYLLDLGAKLIDKKRLGKPKATTWDRIDLIISYLEAWDEVSKLDDDTQFNYVLECLINLANLNAFPTAPTAGIVNPPAVLVGVPGATGSTGATGATGATGLATDLSVSAISVTGAIDSFAVGDANGARWDYLIIEAGGAQRAGQIIAQWTADGANLEFYDLPTDDLVAPTTGFEFDLEFLAGNIRLLAVPTSGVWSFVASRYFIPNNGNGAGPISDVLADGSVFIGNASNVATAQTLSGAFTITNTGVATLGNDVIVNANINSAAAISLSKLAALTANRALLSDGSGIISVSSVTNIELGYLSGASSNIQTQLDTKLTDPTTTIGDIIIRNGANDIARLGIGSANQVLTVSGGVPTWQNVPGGISGLTTGLLPKATSATTLGDSLISESGSSIAIAGNLEVSTGIRTSASGAFLRFIIVNIGDWNMGAVSTANVPHGLGANYIKIRRVDVMLQADVSAGQYLFPLPNDQSNYPTSNSGVTSINATNVNLSRELESYYTSDFNDTSYNRGWITIWYEE